MKVAKKKAIKSNKGRFFVSFFIAGIVLIGISTYASDGVKRVKGKEVKKAKHKALVAEENRTGKFPNMEGYEVITTDKLPEKEVNNFEFFPVQNANAASASCTVWSGKVNFTGYTILADSGAPRYAQSDSRWNTLKYGSRSYCTTYSEAGCAPSAIASAVSAYVMRNVSTIGGYISKTYPQYRDDYTTENKCKSGTNKNAIPAVAKIYTDPATGLKISARKVPWATAKSDLLNYGNPIILRTTNTCFTSEAHYLVIRGMASRNSDGKVFYWINDSSSKNVWLASEYTITYGVSDFWSVGI